MARDVMAVRLHLPQIRVLEVVEDTLWVPETRPWSLTCRDAGRC